MISSISSNGNSAKTAGHKKLIGMELRSCVRLHQHGTKLLLRLPLCDAACTSIPVLVSKRGVCYVNSRFFQTWLAGKSQMKWGFSWENHQTNSEIYHQSTFDYQRALKGIPMFVHLTCAISGFLFT